MGMYTAKMDEVRAIVKRLKVENRLEAFLHITPAPAPHPPKPSRTTHAQAGRSDTCSDRRTENR